MSRLGDTIRMKLESGVLLRERPEKLMAGHGDDEPCSACDSPILRAQVEWSIGNNRSVTHRFHLGCFGLWQAEVRKLGAGTDDQPPPLELIVIQIRLHAVGLCPSCLSEVTDLPLDVVATTLVELGQVVNLAGINGKCSVCGEQRRLVQF